MKLGTERHFTRRRRRASLRIRPMGKYLREIGQGLYGFIVAHHGSRRCAGKIWTSTRGRTMSSSTPGTVNGSDARPKLPSPFDAAAAVRPRPPTGPSARVQGDECDRRPTCARKQATSRRAATELTHRRSSTRRAIFKYGARGHRAVIHVPTPLSDVRGIVRRRSRNGGFRCDNDGRQTN